MDCDWIGVRTSDTVDTGIRRHNDSIQSFSHQQFDMTRLTFLAGGTGTPKLLDGLSAHTDPAAVTVLGNVGDDVEIGGLFVSPDIDTVLFARGGELDRERWWGIEDDTTTTNEEILRLTDAAGLDGGPRYLPEGSQTDGREIARWRRFSGVGEFMTLGDRDRAVHTFRTSLLDEGHSLTEVTRTLADAFDIDVTLLPITDDPVASLIDTDEGQMHFQEFWVHHRGEPTVEGVEFRGADEAAVSASAHDALGEPVIVGPSNPVTSIGPMLAVPGVRAALAETPVVAVSPFVEDEVFSGPAANLMDGVGYEPSTAGVAEAYPFADAFVLDEDDGTDLDRPTVRTDTTLDDPADAERVLGACLEALEVVE
jgi:LPPG:FO 2-phospho-L-lactate transferase